MQGMKWNDDRNHRMNGRGWRGVLSFPLLSRCCFCCRLPTPTGDLLNYVQHALRFVCFLCSSPSPPPPSPPSGRSRATARVLSLSLSRIRLAAVAAKWRNFVGVCFFATKVDPLLLSSSFGSLPTIVWGGQRDISTGPASAHCCPSQAKGKVVYRAFWWYLLAVN